MTRKLALRMRYYWLAGVALLVVGLVAVTTGRTALLGQGSFVRSSASALSNATPVDRGVGSVGFLSQVGGVAFGGTAVPATAGLSITGLRYEPKNSDSERLFVTLGGALTVTADLPDWLMVPTARFAAGDQHACFTLFGSLVDAAETQTVRGQGYDILNYHPAFENTLVGLRLAHADILVLSAASMELPTHDGNYVLGLGESPPNVVANQQALGTLNPFLVDGSGQQIFRSYLITDYQQQVTFNAQSGKLVLDGWPLWYLWRFGVPDNELQAYSDSANAAANNQLNAEYDADILVLSVSALNAKYTQQYVDVRAAELYDEIISPQILEPLPSESRALSAQIRATGGVNPQVYNALTSVMRYAALFRYVRLISPQVYANFVATLPCIVSPTLYTPIAYQVGTPLELDSGSVPGPQSCGTGQGGTGQGGTSQGGTSRGGTGQGGTGQGGTGQGGTGQGGTGQGGTSVIGTATNGGTAHVATTSTGTITNGGTTSNGGTSSTASRTVPSLGGSVTATTIASTGGTTSIGGSTLGLTTVIVGGNSGADSGGTLSNGGGSAMATNTIASTGGSTSGNLTTALQGAGGVSNDAPAGSSGMISGGEAATSDAVGTLGSDSGSSGGCSCRIVERSMPSNWLLIALAIVIARRKKNRDSSNAD